MQVAVTCGLPSRSPPIQEVVTTQQCLPRHSVTSNSKLKERGSANAVDDAASTGTLRVCSYAVLLRGSNGDGTWRGLVKIFDLIDPRPYNVQPPVYRTLIYTVNYVSDRLSAEANPIPRLPPVADLRRVVPARRRIA